VKVRIDQFLEPSNNRKIFKKILFEEKLNNYCKKIQNIILEKTEFDQNQKGKKQKLYKFKKKINYFNKAIYCGLKRSLIKNKKKRIL